MPPLAFSLPGEVGYPDTRQPACHAVVGFARGSVTKLSSGPANVWFDKPLSIHDSLGVG